MGNGDYWGLMGITLIPNGDYWGLAGLASGLTHIPLTQVKINDLNLTKNYQH